MLVYEKIYLTEGIHHNHNNNHNHLKTHNNLHLHYRNKTVAKTKKIPQQQQQQQRQQLSNLQQNQRGQVNTLGVPGDKDNVSPTSSSHTSPKFQEDPQSPKASPVAYGNIHVNEPFASGGYPTSFSNATTTTTTSTSTTAE